MAKLKEMQARLKAAQDAVEAEKAKALEIINAAKAKAAEAAARLAAEIEAEQKATAEAVGEDIGHAIGNLELDPDDVIDAVYQVQIAKVDGQVVAKVQVLRVGVGPVVQPRAGRTRTPSANADPNQPRTLPMSDKAEMIRAMYYNENLEPSEIARRLTDSGMPTSGGECYRAIGPIDAARAKRGH